MQEQTEVAIGLADALMFVIDARAGLTPNDRAFAISRAAPTAGGAGRQQERGQAGRRRRDGILPRWPGRPDPDLGRAWRGLDDLYDSLRG